MNEVETCTLDDVFQIATDTLTTSLCEIPTFMALAVGGSIAYKGQSCNDVDLIPQFSKEFITLNHDEQLAILGKVSQHLPKTVKNVPVDHTFFEIINEYGSLEKYGMIDNEIEPIVSFFDYASELPDEVLFREGQKDNIENIEVLRCPQKFI